MATKKDDATSNLLDALVAHAVRHGGEGATELLDAQAAYHGEPTAAERTAEAEAEAADAHEKGTAANRKQVEDEEKAKSAKEDS